MYKKCMIIRDVNYHGSTVFYSQIYKKKKQQCFKPAIGKIIYTLPYYSINYLEINETIILKKK